MNLLALINKIVFKSLNNMPIGSSEKLIIIFIHHIITRSSAVAVIADRTAYDVRYVGPSYRPLTGIAVVSVSIYLFIVSS